MNPSHPIHILLASLAASFFSIAPALAAPPAPLPGNPALPGVDLRPHFTPGQTARFELWSLQQITVAGQATGQPAQPPMTTTIEHAGEATWTVQKVNPDGSASCTLTFDWTRDKISAQNQEQIIDTRQAKPADPNAATMYDALKALVGTPLTFNVAPDGSVTKVTGADAVRNNAGAAGEAYSDSVLIKLAADLAVIPGSTDNLAPGSSWDHKQDLDHRLGSISQNTHYSLSTTENIAGIPVATVTGRADTTFTLDPNKITKGPDEKPLPLEVALVSSDSTTQIMFDLQRHEAVGRNSVETQQFNTKITLDPRRFAPNSTDPPVVITNTINQSSQSQVLRIAEK